MLAGLTGQIGAGKSTAAAILKSFGAAVIDADRIGREVVEQSAELRRQLAEAFGPAALNGDGSLNRAEVARRAFADDTARRKLNALVHPYLLRELHRQIEELRARYDVVLVDAALLLEWNLDREMDEVLVVTATEEARLDRLAARGISREDAHARQEQQYTADEFASRATRMVPNDGTENDLRLILQQIWNEWTASSPSTPGKVDDASGTD